MFSKEIRRTDKGPEAMLYVAHVEMLFRRLRSVCVLWPRFFPPSFSSLSIFDTPLKITMPKSEVNQQVVISFDYFFYCDCFGNCGSSVSFPSFHGMPSRRWPKPTLGPFVVPPPFNYIWIINGLNGIFYRITIFQSISIVYWLLRHTIYSLLNMER